MVYTDGIKCIICLTNIISSFGKGKEKKTFRPSQSVVVNETQETKATSGKGKMNRKFSWSKLKLKPTNRFQIIIFSYWFQWIGNA